MPDREKVIDGIERLRFFNQRAGRELWGDKPTEIQNHDIADADSILTDALALLKDQEPRVMTLEEIKLLPDESDVFLEEIDCIVVAATISRQCEKWGARTDVTFFYGIESPSYESDEYYNEDYGRWWRCWTSRPTDEQRKAVPWEPPKEEEDGI